jgi:hypothetical protein
VAKALLASGYAVRLLRTESATTDADFYAAVHAAIALDPYELLDPPHRVNWDSLLDSLSGGLYLGPTRVVLTWTGADELAVHRPDLFANFLWMLPWVIGRAEVEKVSFRVVVELDDTTLFDALPNDWVDFDTWRASQWTVQ